MVAEISHFLLLLLTDNEPLLLIMNREIIAEEIVWMLIGSMGLNLAVSLTSGASGLVVIFIGTVS